MWKRESYEESATRVVQSAASNVASNSRVPKLFAEICSAAGLERHSPGCKMGSAAEG